MKNIVKLISCILIISITVFTSSCSKDKGDKEKEETKDNFDIKIATNILDTYMNYLIKDDMVNAKELYSKELLEKDKETSKTELKIFGYKTDEITEVGHSGLFKVRVTRAAPNNPVAILDTYNIKIESGSDYKISEINSNTEKDAFFEEEGIRIRDKNNVKNSLLIDLGGLPQYAFPKDDKGKINKVFVPKTNFGIMNFAYSGDKIAITTYDKDAFVGIVKIDEALLTQGSAGGQGGGQNGGGGKSSGGEGVNIKARETPVGKEMIAIDLIKNSKINMITFSLEEKFLVVEYEKAQQGKGVRVYDVESGEMIPVSLEDDFPFEKVDVVFSSFDKDVLNFQVLEKKTTDKNQSQLIGKWQISLKDFKIKKL